MNQANTKAARQYHKPTLSYFSTTLIIKREQKKKTKNLNTNKDIQDATILIKILKSNFGLYPEHICLFLIKQLPYQSFQHLSKFQILLLQGPSQIYPYFTVFL